jgi:hypothetical protein
MKWLPTSLRRPFPVIDDALADNGRDFLHRVLRDVPRFRRVLDDQQDEPGRELDRSQKGPSGW